MADAASLETDRRHMLAAIRLARRGLGSTAPNPSVGAVIVDPATGEIVGRGWTQPGGRPHAETEALARAGARARAATLYVTLEPCAHHGRTPPCADAIVAAGLARAVVGITDPDPRVAGRGIARLEAAGIGTRRGVLAAACHEITRGHILRVTERRPLVQLKMALAADGTVPRGSGGRPVWVTGPEARAYAHLLRAETDAILVGSATVRDDDPALTCRLPGLAHRSPVRVVLATALDLPPEAQIVAGARSTPTWIVTGPVPEPARAARMAASGAELISLPLVDGEAWLPAVLEALVARGITRVLVEGGPRVWAAFARARLVDEVALFLAGGGAAPASAAQALAAAARYLGPLALGVVSQRALGNDRLWRLAPQPTQDNPT